MSTLESELADSPLARIAREGWKWVLGLGIVQLLCGVLAMAWPGRTVVALGVILGIYLIISGIGLIIAAFGPGVPGFVRAMYALTGMLSVPLGLSCLRDELRSVIFLAVWIGVAWIFMGMTRLVASLVSSGASGRVWTGISGLISIIGGVVLMTYPISSVVTLAWVTGLFLVITGIAYIIESFQLRKP